VKNALKTTIPLGLATVLMSACLQDLGGWQLNSMNEAGVMIGTQAGTQPVKFQDGVLTPLAPDPNARASRAVAIANDGTIVGESDNGVLLWHPDGSLQIIGKMTDMFMNPLLTQPTAVNKHGTIVGSANLNGVLIAWVYENSAFHFLPGRAAVPFDINDAGDIVGQWQTNTDDGGMLWSGPEHTAKELPKPNADPSAICGAKAINELGVIGGYCVGVAAVPVVWDPGANAPRVLPAGPHGEAASIGDINDKGVAVGTVMFLNSQFPQFSTAAAVKWTADGKFVQLDDPATQSGALRINDAGVIAGNRQFRATRYE
jgi:uncharacterized membrane protein